jgi:tryptophan-rich sensory protein
LALAGWVALTFCAPVLGVISQPGAWYDSLEKPSWNPPSWIFGPVWTTLYLMMAVAAWRVWQRGGWLAQRRPLTLYLVQLALNAIWSPLFFLMQRPDLALVDILLLWAALVLTLRAFWRVDTPAGLLLVPYLAWVSFATGLNLTLWQMNR